MSRSSQRNRAADRLPSLLVTTSRPGHARAPRSPHTRLAVVAGAVSAIVGFSSSFAVVLAGLRAVGASADQAASGLLVLSLAMGAGCVLFSWRWRRPITMAWSTPGAALLASLSAPAGGFATSVAAFLVVGALLALTGLVPALAASVRRIPAPVAQAMLAGVLLQLCIVPFHDLPQEPVALGAVLVTWAVLARLAPRWAVPGAVGAAAVVLVARGSFAGLTWAAATPHLAWTTPSWPGAAALAIAVPLYLVTMTSQNIPGVAVMAGLGYEVPWRPALAYTGGATIATAGFGGFAINLSAIAAALAAGPEAGPDPQRRWVAGVSTGVGYLLLGLSAPAVVTVAQHAPAGLLASIAGVALLGTFGAAALQALAEESLRLPAAVTLVVASSGVVVGGVGSAFWSLVVGGALVLLGASARRERLSAGRAGTARSAGR